MTFYEAALRVLEGAGHPLHVLEITEKSIAQNLLSHIGKTPEQTMLSRLAAMARRARDRRVIVTAKDTFALADWALPEDAEALAQTGVPEPHPEDGLPPLRPAERHPEARTENVRAAGRSERKRRRDEDDDRGRKRRYPPVSEVVFEILSEVAEALRPEEIVEKARARELASDELSTEQILSALLEDNQRRIDVGRRPQFIYHRESGTLALERAGSPSEAPPLELQAAFAAALGIPLEGGRPVLPRREAAVDGSIEAAQQSLKMAAKDARRTVARALRRRLGELDVGTFEKSAVKMMHGLGFRELKVAKRSKEGPLLTARRREGSLELRYAVRLLKGTPSIERRMVQELRRDLGHYAAQVGLLVSAGDVRGEAKTEALTTGALVLLWCGDGLGDKFLEAEAGVTVKRIEAYEIDERFFDAARVDAEEALRRREERSRERKQERGDVRESVPVVETPEIAVPVVALEGTDSAEGDEDEGEEGDADLDAAEAFTADGKAEPGGEGRAAADRKRRRRRRRGRRGRAGGGEAGAQGAGSAANAAAAAENGGAMADAGTARHEPPSESSGGSGEAS